MTVFKISPIPSGAAELIGPAISRRELSCEILARWPVWVEALGVQRIQSEMRSRYRTTDARQMTIPQLRDLILHLDSESQGGGQ